MSWESEELKHVLPQAPGVYFVMPGRLSQGTFDAAVRVLSSRAACDTAATPETQWAAFEDRLMGHCRWDAIVPRDTELVTTPEEGRRKRESFHSVANILRHRPYVAYTIEGVQYVLDLFNPANELQMQYKGAGEVVIALLLRPLEHGTLQHRLVLNTDFYQIVREVADALDAEFVCGDTSLAAVMFAYEQGRLDVEHRPWMLLYPLSLLRRPSVRASDIVHSRATTTNDSIALLWPILLDPRISETPVARLLRKVDVWDSERILIQVADGLDGVMRSENVEAARMLGLKAVQELLP